MQRRFLLAKIRDVQITATLFDYEGSITIDEEYLIATGILPNEAVDVLNVNNGERFTTYVIKGEKGSGAIELNGPAARLGLVGDKVMILAYGMLVADEISSHTPKILCVQNQPRTQRADRTSTKS